MTVLDQTITKINTGLAALGHEKQALTYLEQANSLEGQAQREALQAARKEQADAIRCWTMLVLLHKSNREASAIYRTEQKTSAGFLTAIDELLGDSPQVDSLR